MLLSTQLILKEKAVTYYGYDLIKMVGMRGFEPPTPDTP